MNRTTSWLRTMPVLPLVILIVTILFIVGLTFSRFNIESILHLIGQRSERESQVRIELSMFKKFAHYAYDFTASVDSRGHQPPASIQEILDRQFPERTNQFGAGRNFAFKYLAANVDPWGSPFVFENVQTGEYSCRVTVRSRGANGVDEHGKGDDLQRAFDLWLGR